MKAQSEAQNIQRESTKNLRAIKEQIDEADKKYHNLMVHLERLQDEEEEQKPKEVQTELELDFDKAVDVVLSNRYDNASQNYLASMLHNMRKKAGLNLQQVAEAVGVSDGTIHRIEKSERIREVKFDTIIKMYSYLSIQLEIMRAGAEAKKLG